MADDFSCLDATAQAALVASGEVSPRELVAAAIDAVERTNPALNAVIHERFERALAEADRPLPDGPFRGVPFLVKDLDGMLAGEPYHAGCAHLRAAGYVADHTSHVMGRLLGAGLVCIGKTNTPELGLIPSAEPATYGPTHNPWDLGRSAGGSSGGSAAAVAAGIVPVAHAGDGGGSIRIPSSECGLVGLKPTRGRHSLGPELGEAWGGLVARMLLTRTVRDCAAALDVVASSAPGDPYTAALPERPFLDATMHAPSQLRVGWTTTSPDVNVATHHDVAAAVALTAKALESIGHHVEEAAPAVWSDPAASAELTGAFLCGFGVWTARELETIAELTGTAPSPETVEPLTWAVAELGRAASALQYHRAVDALHAHTRRLAEFWSVDGFDLLLTPTIPEPPLVLGQFAGTADNPLAGLFRAAGVVPFTVPFNVSGQPAISLPLHESEGLPIGVQLVAAAGREDLLLAVAAQLELALPWEDRRPLTHAATTS